MVGYSMGGEERQKMVGYNKEKKKRRKWLDILRRRREGGNGWV